MDSSYQEILILHCINQPDAFREFGVFPYDPKSDGTDIIGTISPYVERNDLNRLPDFSLTSLDRPNQGTYWTDPSRRPTDPPLLVQNDFTAGKCPYSCKLNPVNKRTRLILQFSLSLSLSQKRGAWSLWILVRVENMLLNGILILRPIHVLSSGLEVAMATKTDLIVNRSAENPV